MTAVSIVLGAGGPLARAVRDILRDWSAAELVGEYLWVDEVDAVADLSVTPADLVRAGRVHRAGVQEHLANRMALSRVRLCVLSALGGTPEVVDTGTAQLFVDELRRSASAAQVTSVHGVVTRHGRGGWRPEAVWPGWLTAVVAPEDAWNPGESLPVRQVFGLDDDAFHAHAAAAVASLVGLWTGMGQAPLDTMVTHVDRAVVVRSFVRRLDASEVADGLRSALTDVTHGLPRPTVAGRATEYFDSPQDACRQVATSVLGRHADLLRATREQAQVGESAAIGVMALLRMYLAFLWAALRSAPRVWLESLVDRAAASAARRVQGAVFGGRDSRYQVVVAGRRADGTLVGVAELGEAAEALTANLRAVQHSGELRLPKLSGFWRDVVGGALTLADGGSHVTGVAAPLAGGLPAVVQRPTLIAPEPSMTFPLPGNLAAEFALLAVPAYDVAGGRQVFDALAEIEHGRSARAAEAGETRSRLDAWFAEHGSSYLNIIGKAVSEALNRSRRDVQSLLQQLSEAAAGLEVPLDVDTGARKLARSFRTRLWVCLGVVAVLLGTGRLGVVRWRWVIVLVALTILGYVISCAISWYRSQQADFARLHARRRAESNLEILQRNLTHAAGELYLHSVMYSQYLAWAPAIGRFLSEPFGRAVPRDRVAARLCGLLPRSMGLAVARCDPARVRARADSLKPELFPLGWLDQIWSRAMDGATEQASRQAGAGETDAEVLYADRAMTDGSPLRQWSAATCTGGVSTAAGDALWASAVTRLERGGTARLVQELFTDVELPGHPQPGRPGRVRGSDLLTQLTATAGHPRPFEPAIFTPDARVRGAGPVRDTFLIGDDDVLNSSEAAVDDATAREPSRSDAHLATARVSRLSPAAAAARDLDQFVVVLQVSDAVGPDDITLLGPPADLVAAPGSLRSDPRVDGAADRRERAEHRADTGADPAAERYL